MDYIKILEKLKPFFALMILVFIVLSCIGLWNYVNLQKEIKDNCGYERGDKVFCVCDKNMVSQIPLANNPYYENPEDLIGGNLIGSLNQSGS